MTWLAQHLWPGEADRVGAAPGRAAAPTTPAQFRQVFGRSLERRLARLDRVGARVPADEPRGDPPASDDAVPGRLAPRARLDLARVLRREGGQALRRLQLPGRRRARRRDRRRRPARSSGSPTSRARSSTRSRRWPTTPTAQQLFYTTDNGAHRDLVRVDPRTAQDASC